MNWPIVTHDDGGTGPANDLARCFYCHSRVGSPHGQECVCVLKRVKYFLFAKNHEVGTWEHNDPYFWDAHDCESHKNESSWCADNAVKGDTINWSTDKHSQQVKVAAEEAVESNNLCCCGFLEFKFDKVVLPGPFREEDIA